MTTVNKASVRALDLNQAKECLPQITDTGQTCTKGSPEMKADCISEKSTETPTLELLNVTQLPENTNCLACSEDGMYLCLGHSRGLSVWCASSLTRAAEWLQDGLEVNFIQMTRMTAMTYLLGTVDDMGVARVFLHHTNGIHLLSVINAMEDINKRSICLTLDLFEGGNYGVSSFSCNGAVWLEVYQFPSAAWLTELEMVAKQKRDLNLATNVGTVWPSVATIIKIEPPRILAGKTFAGTVGDFLMHCLYADVSGSRKGQGKKSSCNTNQGKPRKTSENPRNCTHHFLLPCDHLPSDSKENFQPEADVEPTPDVLWPNAKEILCSAVSRCTRYIALGLDDAVVCVWDRRSDMCQIVYICRPWKLAGNVWGPTALWGGAPLSTVLVPSESNILSTIQFFSQWPVSARDSLISSAETLHLLVLCNGGEMYRVTIGQETQPCTMRLTERSKDNRGLPTVATSVPFLQGVSFVVQRNGRMFLQDVINNAIVCYLTPPTSYQITSPCNPVYVLNTKQQSLSIRGDLDSSCSRSSQRSSHSQLFVFRFGQSDTMKQHIVSHPESPHGQKTLGHITLEESCNLYLEQRVLLVDQRNKAIERTWKRLQETALMTQHGQQLRKSSK